MQYKSRMIASEKKDILEIVIIDSDDVMELSKYSGEDCIQIDLNSIQYLDEFECIRTLILTGGMPTSEGLDALYRQKSITHLILDYEETDSDEEGIDLTSFPNLQYVMSRSNLNIYRLADFKESLVQVEILNYYNKGRKEKVQYAANHNLFQSLHKIFFSTEAKSPASVTVIKILMEIETALLQKYEDKSFSGNLDSMAFILICMPQEMLDQGFGRERKYVSIKRRYADIRLQISYDAIITGNKESQYTLCLERIKDAAKYISTKDHSFLLEDFLAAIDDIRLSLK